MKYLKYFENKSMNMIIDFDDQEIHKYFTGEYDVEWKAIALILKESQLDGEELYELIYQFILDRFGKLSDDEIVEIVSSFEFEYLDNVTKKYLYEDAIRYFLQNNNLVQKIKNGRKIDQSIIDKIKRKIDQEKFGL